MRKLIFSFISISLLFCYCSKEKHGIDLANMDLSVEPTQDFYQYANGSWLKNNTIPESESHWGVLNELRDANKQALHNLLTEVSATDHPSGTIAQKVGDFYRSGMDLEQIEKNGYTPIQSYLNDIETINDIKDLLKVVANQQKIGSKALFTIFIDSDFKNSEMNTIYIYQAGLGMPDRDYYLEKGAKFEKYRSEYMKHLKKIFELVGDDSIKAMAAANTINNIETQLAKASWTRTELRNIPKMYNKRTIEEANKETPNINWQSYFGLLGLKDIDYFIIAQPNFFQEVNTLLTGVSIDNWKTYLRWHLIKAMAPYLSSDFVNQDFYFFENVLLGIKKLKPRWKLVIEMTDNALGEALGQLYVEKFFPPEAKLKANQIVNNLREAYRQRIEKLDWMSDKTKKYAFDKLKQLVQKIGYPDKWRDYSSLEINQDSYVLNIIRANVFEFNRNLKKIGNPVDKTEWGMSPPTVNAYSNPLWNEVVFPAGILQPPYFDPKADDAVNYGAMGVVIGHEITHGYDDQGRLFDSDGNMNNWWTDKDKELFDAKTKVIEEQFNKYVVLDSVHINGKLTLGENIADLGGLSVAYDALQISLEKSGRPGLIGGFTPEQRFFISYASIWHSLYRDDALLNKVKTDPHAPPYYRVIGPLSNMPEFFEAFKVQLGDPMRRPDSLLAKVW